jgi:NADPH:quinone reductase-like Zn-dependent oxidoreductase
VKTSASNLIPFAGLSAVVGGNSQARPNTNDLVAPKQLVESARMMPIVNRTYSMSDTPDAIPQLEEGHARGKVVITV